MWGQNTRDLVNRISYFFKPYFNRRNATKIALLAALVLGYMTMTRGNTANSNTAKANPNQKSDSRQRANVESMKKQLESIVHRTAEPYLVFLDITNNGRKDIIYMLPDHRPSSELDYVLMAIPNRGGGSFDLPRRLAQFHAKPEECIFIDIDNKNGLDIVYLIPDKSRFGNDDLRDYQINVSMNNGRGYFSRGHKTIAVLPGQPSRFNARH